MKEKINCEYCVKKRSCNTFDRARNMPCKEFKVNKSKKQIKGEK